MKTSKELLKAAGIQPKLRLGTKTSKGVVPNGPHRVKLIADKVITKPDQKTGKDRDYVRYLVVENGETKTYDTKKNNDAGDLSYLVQRLAEIEEKQEVILEMKKAGAKNYIEVTPVSGGHTIQVEADDVDDDIQMDDEGFPGVEGDE